MSKILKIGIIGCGGIANGKHMPTLKLFEEVEMVAFCDIIEERAIKAAKEYGVKDAKVYTDYKELLKDSSIDVIHVLTPNKSHSEISVAALNSGKHVMCEKPMAKTAAGALEMVKAAEKTGKKLTIGYQARHYSSAEYLKAASLDNEFGEIYFAKAHAVRRRAVPTWGVFLNEEEQGGGALIDIGTHSLDMTLWIMDNYEPHYAVGNIYKKFKDQKNTGNEWGEWDSEKFTVEDSAFGFVTMKNGATVIVESSWALNIIETYEYSTTICGTKGGATQANPRGLILNGCEHGKLWEKIPKFASSNVAFYEGDKCNPTEKEARAWIDCILNDTEPFVKPYQAYTVTRILEGIYTSAKTGKPYYFD